MDKIICLGKNYLGHAKEMGDPIPETPLFFLKPPSVSVEVQAQKNSVQITLPRNRGAVNYECEIILKLNAKAEIIAVSLGLDLTLRDVQKQLKKDGYPWEVSKVFPQSAIIGPWIPIGDFKDYLDKPFTFKLNGCVRQQDQGKNMRFGPKESSRFAAQFFPICQGDIVFTGTPEGVGEVLPGDLAEILWNSKLEYQVKFI